MIGVFLGFWKLVLVFGLFLIVSILAENTTSSNEYKYFIEFFIFYFYKSTIKKVIHYI